MSFSDFKRDSKIEPREATRAAEHGRPQLATDPTDETLRPAVRIRFSAAMYDYYLTPRYWDAF
jgi:hypothetical protein